MKITKQNIMEEFEKMRIKMDKELEGKRTCFHINVNKKVLNRDSYLGRGRPKNSDYNFVRDEELLSQLYKAGYKILAEKLK